MENFPVEIVTDTRLIQQEHSKDVLRGAKQIQYASFIGSGDNKRIHFNCPPRTPNSEIDRNIQLLIPVRLTVTVPTGVPAASFIFQPDQCNFRSYPLQKSFRSMSMTLNNQKFEVQLAPIISALEHYNTSRRLKLLEYSKGPVYGVNHCQRLHDLDSGTRSGLAFFANSIAGIAPQAFPFTVVSQTNDGLGSATSVIDAVLIENIWISPLHWGLSDNNTQAFKGISNMSFDFQFLEDNPGARMIAIDDFQLLNQPAAAGLYAADPTITMQVQFDASDNFKYSDLKPKLLVQYIEPQCVSNPVKPSFLKQFEFNTYQKTFTALTAGSDAILDSNTINLNARPRQFYIFVQRPLKDLTDSPYHGDTFFGIEDIELYWNGIRVLETAHMAQIYDISVKNGLQLEYGTWRGLGYNNATTGVSFGTTANQFASTGTVICLDIMDLGLSEEFISKNTEQYSLQVKVKAKNLARHDTLVPVLNVVVLTDYLVKIDAAQNSVQNRIAQPVVVFDEKRDCKYIEPSGQGVKDIRFAKRSGDWIGTRPFIKKGDVFPF